MYTTPIRPYELYHHGILGMHWGIRRFQNKDGSLKPAGESRYGVDEKSNNKSEKSSSGNRTSQSASVKKRGKLTPEQKSKIRKVLIAAGAITVASLAAYAIHRKVARDFIGAELKKGTTLQRMSLEGTSLHDQFYAAFGKHDMNRYEKGMSYHFANRGKDAMNKMTLNASKNIKAPSNHEAKKIFNDLAKSDSTFREHLKTNFINNYDQFNRDLAGPRNQELKKRFSEALKSKGYNAIIDVNDQKYSGYSANKPLIIFDKTAAAISKIEKVPIDKAVGNKEINKAGMEILLKDQAVPLGIALGTIGTANVAMEESIYQSKKRKQKK